MDLFSQILESFGIKDYDKLTSAEQDTLKSWVSKVEKASITLEDVKKGMITMREMVEAELVKHETQGRKDIYLKARLKNLILLETILNRPDRAKAALEGYIQQAKVAIK